MLLKKIIYLTATIITLYAKSQAGYLPGYIVDIKGDTLSGFVKLSSERVSEKICYFRKDMMQEEMHYSPKELRGYGFRNGWIYRSNQFAIDINKLGPTFIRIVVDGSMDLFYSNDTYFIKSTKSNYTYILNKEGKDHIRVLSSLIVNECFELANLVSRARLIDDSLIGLFEKYHECINEPFYTYPDIKSSRNFGFGIETSHRSINSTSNKGFEEFDNVVPVSTGLILKTFYTTSVVPHSKLKMHFEGGYSLQANYLLDFEGENNYETRFSFSSIYTSANLRYELPVSKQLEVIGQIGLGSYFNFGASQSRNIDVVSGNNVFLSSADDSFEISKVNMFINQNLLLVYNQTADRQLFIELFRRSGLSSLINASSEYPSSDLSSKSSELGIGIGVIFRTGGANPLLNN